MDLLEDTKKYRTLMINGVVLMNVQVFIKKMFVELYDYEGKKHIGVINKDDIKTISVGN